MPAHTEAIIMRALRAALALQADHPHWTISALRRMDGELRHACPMYQETAWRAIEELLDRGDLREQPDSNGARFRVMRGRRDVWTNKKRRESKDSTAA